MDIVITDIRSSKIMIIEFNQFGAETVCGSCLYNWDLDYEILYNAETPDKIIIEKDNNLEFLF